MNKEKEKIVLEKLVLLNKEEVAEIFGYCKQTVNRLFNATDFPVIKYGKTHLVELDALKQYINDKKVAS